jgi:hypothetical protein
MSLATMRAGWLAGLVCVSGITGLAATEGPSAQVTFSKDVAPIVYKHCVSCHRAGTTAPMSLLTYREARPWAASIREKVVARVMPPWNADPRYGKWQNDPHLTDAEIAAIVSWSRHGAPEGNPKDMPPVPPIAEGWHIGKPDVVFQMEEAFTVPATQELDMQYFILDPHFTEDKWIQAAEVFPGNRHVVHHSTLYIMEPGVQVARPRNNQFPGVVSMPDWEFKPSNGKAYKGTEIEQRLGVVETRTHETFAEMGHGDPSSGWPLGTAKLIKAGSKLVLQVHYHPSGKEETDLSKVGFVFCKGVPQHQIYALGVVNMNFEVPAGDPNYEVKAEATFLKQVHLWSLQPHMHLRGKDMEYRLIYPDGRSEVILFVPRYDFNNKYTYNLAEAKIVPVGTKMVVTAHFDNSANNKLNPDPTVVVKRGLQTTDEMMNGHVYMTIDDEVVPGYTAPVAMNANGHNK